MAVIETFGTARYYNMFCTVNALKNTLTSFVAVLEIGPELCAYYFFAITLSNIPSPKNCLFAFVYLFFE